MKQWILVQVLFKYCSNIVQDLGSSIVQVLFKILIQVLFTKTGTTSPASILSASFPCREEIYLIASRITSSCETLSFTHTDGTSSFNLESSSSASAPAAAVSSLPSFSLSSFSSSFASSF